MDNLYTPPDVWKAHEAWQASCGPCSLAAILRRPVVDCKPLFPDFPGWCNIRTMRIALDAAGARYRVRYPHDNGLPAADCFPRYGLAFVQIEGPWTQPGVPVAARYKHAHWIGAAKDGDQVTSQVQVYEVNVADPLRPYHLGEWLPAARWVHGPLKAIMASPKNKRSTGWSVWAALEVEVARDGS